ncbi:MAG: NADPH:quinone reductase [Porticoccaceae bacterium]|nr:NADPH:quinone reductase [Porticoccaceae bacterium]MDG1475082.1 NADPH:quinone reductase [Porticoccaceae bacterium]
MKAAWFEQFGVAKQVLNIGEQPKPIAGCGQVLVKVITSGVNPSDVKKRAGSSAKLLHAGLVIPHSDGAGVIEAVGDNVSRDRIGQRVWVYQAQYDRQLGTAAEYVAVDTSRAVALPDSVDFAVGACLGIPAMTAHRCVYADGDIKGQRVLVTGGAGRVGYYAIQWAVMAGAEVITTASNPEDRGLCLSLGAKAVVNHRDKDWGQQVLQACEGKKVDRVIDVEFGANLSQILTCVATGGVIATYSSTQVTQPTLPFLEMMFMDLTLRMVIVYAMPEAAKLQAIDAITEALTNNKLQHRVIHKLKLDQISQSHELIEQSGCRGCVVIQMT